MARSIHEAQRTATIYKWPTLTFILWAGSDWAEREGARAQGGRKAEIIGGQK